MKITKPGFVDVHPWTGKCQECGCEFEMRDDEVGHNPMVSCPQEGCFNQWVILTRINKNKHTMEGIIDSKPFRKLKEFDQYYESFNPFPKYNNYSLKY